MNNDIRPQSATGAPVQAGPEPVQLAVAEPMDGVLPPADDRLRVSVKPGRNGQLDVVAEAPKIATARLVGAGLMVLALLAGAALVVIRLGHAPPGPAAATGTDLAVASQTIALGGLSRQLAASALVAENVLTVNGNVDVNGQLIIVPSGKPAIGTAGQLYFDQSSNQLNYFNGTSYVALQSGGAVTNIYNTTNAPVTNIIGAQIPTGTTTAASGTAGSLAMFLGPTSLGNSMVTQVGNALNTGTSVQQVTLGAEAGGSSATLQGGTGNVSILTGDTTGSSGSITVQTGASSTTAAGNVNIDTGSSVLNGTLIADKTFEDGNDNMGQGIYGDNSTTSVTTAEAHSGTHSLEITVGSNFFPSWAVGDGTATPAPYIIPVTAGHTYAFSAWVRAGSNSDTITASVIWSNDGYAGGGEISQQTFGTVTDISSGWRKVAGILVAPVGSYRMGFYFYSNDASAIGEVHYFDDITVTDLSGSSAMAAVNIGATNAQQITIGNSAMFAPTDIYGGGVNINAGTGFMNLSGSNIDITSGGATYSTTTGALDISAATTSTWEVAGSAGAGGSLTIAGGNAGGTGNTGGNLVLQGGAATGTGAGGGVIVKPRTDNQVAFAVQNASGANIISVDTQTQVINDPMTTSAPIGTLGGGAVWQSGQDVVLNNGTNQNGEVNYTASPGNSFDATFNFYATAGADATYFYAYNTSIPSLPNAFSSSSGGYTFVYDEYRAEAEIWFNGTQLASAAVGGIGSSTWHSAEVIKSGDSLAMKMDGSTVLSYTDIARILGGTNFGIAGFSGVVAGEHATDDFVLSQGSAPAVLAVSATAQFNNDVSVLGTVAASQLLAGQTTVQDDSSTALAVQSTSGADLFTADTSGLNITISGSDTAFATLVIDNSHFESLQTTAPQAGTPINCGTTPTAALSAGSTDSAGSVIVTAGSGTVSGPCSVTVTFHQSYGSVPKSVIVTPTTAVGTAPAGKTAVVSQVTTTGFTLTISPATPAAGEVDSYYYWVIE